MSLSEKIPNADVSGNVFQHVYNDTGSDIGAYRPVQIDPVGTHALSVKSPSEPGLLAKFIGITKDTLKNGQGGVVVTSGYTQAVVLATATTNIGSYLYPVTVSGSSYLKESKTITPITLLEDITASAGSQVTTNVIIDRDVNQYGAGNIVHDIWISPDATSTTAVHAALACAITEQTVSTSITNPDVPRNLTATTTGTSGDVAAVSVIVTGTDVFDQAITETLPAFTVNTNGTVTGSKAFKTVTSYVVPAMDGTGCNVSIGIGSKLGLIHPIQHTALIKAAVLDGTLEGTAPTLTGSTGGALSAVSTSTATLNSSLNATQTDVYYYV